MNKSKYLIPFILTMLSGMTIVMFSDLIFFPSTEFWTIWKIAGIALLVITAPITILLLQSEKSNKLIN